MENKIKNQCTSHLYGEVTKINMRENKDGSTRVLMNVRTLRFYEKDGQKHYPTTNHTVTVNTSDEAFLKTAKGIESKIAERDASFEEKANNKDAKIVDFPKVSLDAVPVMRMKPALIKLENGEPVLDKDGKLTFVHQEGENVGKLLNEKGEAIMFRNSEYVAKPETIKVDQPLQEKEVRNKTTLKGNIRAIKHYEKDEFMTLYVDTHYYAPNPNPKEGEKEYKEMTSEHIVKLNKDRSQAMEKVYNDIVNGEIATGDLITVQGPKYETSYPVKGQFNGKEYEFNRYELYTSASSLNLEMRAKKNQALEAGEKVEKAPEAKVEKKEAAKAAPAKKAESKKATSKKAAEKPAKTEKKAKTAGVKM